MLHPDCLLEWCCAGASPLSWAQMFFWESANWQSPSHAVRADSESSTGDVQAQSSALFPL